MYEFLNRLQKWRDNWQQKNAPLTSFATALRSWGDVGKVMKGIIGAPD